MVYYWFLAFWGCVPVLQRSSKQAAFCSLSSWWERRRLLSRSTAPLPTASSFWGTCRPCRRLSERGAQTTEPDPAPVLPTTGGCDLQTSRWDTCLLTAWDVYEQDSKSKNVFPKKCAQGSPETELQPRSFGNNVHCVIYTVLWPLSQKSIGYLILNLTGICSHPQPDQPVCFKALCTCYALELGFLT